MTALPQTQSLEPASAGPMLNLYVGTTSQALARDFTMVATDRDVAMAACWLAFQHEASVRQVLSSFRRPALSRPAAAQWYVEHFQRQPEELVAQIIRERPAEIVETLASLTSGDGWWRATYSLARRLITHEEDLSLWDAHWLLKNGPEGSPLAKAGDVALELFRTHKGEIEAKPAPGHGGPFDYKNGPCRIKAAPLTYKAGELLYELATPEGNATLRALDLTVACLAVDMIGASIVTVAGINNDFAMPGGTSTQRDQWFQNSFGCCVEVLAARVIADRQEALALSLDSFHFGGMRERETFELGSALITESEKRQAWIDHCRDYSRKNALLSFGSSRAWAAAVRGGTHDDLYAHRRGLNVQSCPRYKEIAR